MRLLEGIRVVEVGGGLSASYATKLFADFGADVVKVETPQGDPTRRMAPFLGNQPGEDSSAVYLHTNTNKRSVVLDLHADGDRGTFADLVATADLLVESYAPGTLDSWNLGFDALRRRRPRLVMVSITPFGQDGPYAGYQGSEVVYYGMGGPMLGNGTPDGEPVKLGGYMSLYQLGNSAATAAMAALMVAESPGGEAVHVDVNGLESQLTNADRRTTFLLNYAYNHVSTDRASALLSVLPNGAYPTADGYVQMVVTMPWVPRMLAAIGDPELDELFARIAQDPSLLARPETKEAIDASLYPWLLDRTKQEVMETAQRHKWPVTALKTPVEVLEDEHFVQRGFFTPVDHPTAGRVVHPGAPFHVADGWELRTPAPRLGQHTEEVLGELTADRAPAAPLSTAAQQ